MDIPPLVSLIVPCYNEGAGLASFLRAVNAQAQQGAAYAFEFLFVDDGSTDESSVLLHRFAQTDPRVKVVRLARNFGHQRAITAGIDLARGDYLIVLDADMQDPPELIPDILDKLAEGYDVVHMVRSKRQVDSLAKRSSAALFYAIMRRWVLPELPVNAGDFKGISRRAADALRQYPERVRFLRGMLATLGFRQVELPYVREARRQGRSKYRLRSILRLGRDAVVSNTVLPLRMAFYLGALLLAVITPLYYLVLLLRWSAGMAQSPLLWVLLGLQFPLSGMLLLMLGTAGEYLKVLMLEVKRRPQYLVESTQNLEKKQAGE